MKLWWKEWRKAMGEAEGSGELRGLTEARDASATGATRGAGDRGDSGGEGQAGAEICFGASPSRPLEIDACAFRFDPCGDPYYNRLVDCNGVICC
jgi:hypothetical protein